MLSRKRIIEILEGAYSIACYDEESTEMLWECLVGQAEIEGDSLLLEVEVKTGVEQSFTDAKDRC